MIISLEEISAPTIGVRFLVLLLKQMLKKLGLYCLLLNLAMFVSAVALPNDGHGQGKIGFVMPPKTKKIEVPFEIYNNLIVIPVTINDKLTLQFILDTGAESAILTEKLFGDLLGLNYVRQINVNAPGEMDSLEAFVATNIKMSLPGDISGVGLNMLVLKEDYLELNKNLGVEVYGIIGYDVFSRFTINIDYDNKLLTFYSPDTFKPRKSQTRIPMKVINTKPFITMSVQQKERVDTVTLMVDSGASHAMLLDVDSMNQINLPKEILPTALGQGLAGEIPGYVGRMGGCSVLDFNFNQPLVSIPISGSYMKAIKRGSRQGTVGGDILSRFNTTFDYNSNALYVTKGDRYNEKFEYNMSGMVLGVFGKGLDSIRVVRVLDDSPAKEIGIVQGDVIKSINGKNLHNSKFTDVISILRSREGKKLRVVLWRDDKKLKLKLRLRRMI
ncbi:MAG: hypothetical protein CMB80_04325 [Flammeovirgaceae bacterium]|nr:hypothetical protein [Flammeovirgaceae bacterium]MBR10029.1 hypothetical protein [Rickettsiales bacterium]HCX25035.1 hypothetical protein [Cytophagales bacterium]|tara:strand:+ start:8976 stop:10304 length:1329 start_codon:yes stop_codon:yes gene_type:complete